MVLGLNNIFVLLKNSFSPERDNDALLDSNEFGADVSSTVEAFLVFQCLQTRPVINK